MKSDQSMLSQRDESTNHVRPTTDAVDCRFPARPMWLSRSSIDFLDVHIYEKDGTPAALAKNIRTEEWGGINTSKPILMGEFGCNDHWYDFLSVIK